MNVLNNQVWQPVTNGLWTGPDGKTYGSGSTGGGSSGTVTTAVTTSTAPVTAPSVSTSQTESVCQAGTNQCSGAAVQICDYVSNANGGVLGRLFSDYQLGADADSQVGKPRLLAPLPAL